MSAKKQLTESKYNGLTAWRERQRLEREWRLARLEELRQDATEEERDGQTFRVVRIPDNYDQRERIEPQVQLRSRRNRKAA